MALTIYNTLTRKKEPFEPIVDGRVGIYVCGPTVYQDPHIGNARGPVFFDVVRRWLEHEGYRVRYVSNITDVGHLTDDADEGEDKLAKRARLEQLEPMEVAETYFWRYFDAMDALGVRRPSIVPRASGHMPEQIAMVEALLERGIAYRRGGNVYFDVSKWEDYGELSGRTLEETREGTRVKVRHDKDDPRDFALWIEAPPEHIMRWDSPWGAGYPGWHLECSVMSTKYLGEEFDIHGGGLDLIFPHHECELAQARAAGKPFARYWVHWNFLTFGGEKMAKSKGASSLIETLTEHRGPALRFHLLSAHYRSLLDFSDDSLHASAQGLRRINESYRELLRRLGRDSQRSAAAGTDRSHRGADSGMGGDDPVRGGGGVAIEGSHAESGDDPAAQQAGSAAPDRAPASLGRAAPPPDDPLRHHREQFKNAMNDDFNTAQAIAALFDAVREINAHLAENASREYLHAAHAFLDDLAGGVLGVLDGADVQESTDLTMVDGLVKLVVAQREEARKRRDFATADAIRDELGTLGVTLEDTPTGTRWKLDS